jgi:hypothetical protein
MSVFTPKCVISYPHLYTPQMPNEPRPGQKARYSCVLLFPQVMDDEDQVLFRALMEAALAKGIEKWGSKEKVEEFMQMHPQAEVALPQGQPEGRWLDQVGQGKVQVLHLPLVGSGPGGGVALGRSE